MTVEQQFSDALQKNADLQDQIDRQDVAIVQKDKQVRADFMQDNNRRLASLDILRGLVLFMLVFFQPILMQIGAINHCSVMERIVGWFTHAEWEGLNLWDLVMPLFLFMAGASMPFAFSKYAEVENKWPVYRKIAKRVLILFVFGMVVQGNLLGLAYQYFRFYSNTLQAIAAGYLIASMILLHFNGRIRVALTCLLLLIYWIPMQYMGDYTPDGNFAEMVDKFVLGHWRDGVWWDENGMWHFSAWYHYTWIWSSLTFGVTVMLGVFAGQIIKDGSNQRALTAKKLFVGAVILLLIGYLHSFNTPINKRLWTTSMTLVSGGWCWGLLAITYWIVDAKGLGRHFAWLKIYGTNSIVAYIVGEVVNFGCIVESVSYGLQPWLGQWYQVWLTFGNALILFLILLCMYKSRIFIKV